MIVYNLLPLVIMLFISIRANYAGAEDYGATSDQRHKNRIYEEEKEEEEVEDMVVEEEEEEEEQVNKL